MHTPIWWCIIKQEPLGNGQLACYRIIKAIACEAKDIGELWDQHADMFTMTVGYMPMYFHRDPAESPLLEAARKQEPGILPVDIDVAVRMTEDYTDW